MFNEYKEKLDIQKEVLSALPRNNIKNQKAYASKVDELLSLYNENKNLLYGEIKRRIKGYNSSLYDKEIDNLTIEIDNLYSKLPLINSYSSSYEKSGLDVVLYTLEHFYTVNIEEVNKNILLTLKIFNEVGINLSYDDFNYSYYANLYMEMFLNSMTNDKLDNEALKKFFDDIYWRCPNIITHITLNFKYLYCLNRKRFDDYYDGIIEKLKKEDIYDKYKSLYKEREKRVESNKYILLNKFLTAELDINDYTLERVNKAYKAVVKGGIKNDKINIDVVKLSYSLFEYGKYLDLKYIIDDIKKLYQDKDKYRNSYINKKKEIVKEEKRLFSENRKILKMIKRGKKDKINCYTNIIDNHINILKGLYDDLLKNIFYEEIAKLNDNATLYDILYLASSNYGYLNEIVKREGKDINEEIGKIREFVYYPHINILNNILIGDEKDIALIIIDRYNLFGLDISREEIEKDNLPVLIKEINIILNSVLMSKLDITENKIKFINTAKNIIDSEEK